jgi:hypothetical protein
MGGQEISLYLRPGTITPNADRREGASVREAANQGNFGREARRNGGHYDRSKPENAETTFHPRNGWILF